MTQISKKRRVKTKKRFLPFFFFVLVLTGTCLFLYSTAMPDLAGSAPRDKTAPDLNKGVGNAVPLTMAPDAKFEISGNVISATGVGRVPDGTAQGKLLGRRAAITDARRNLLVQRQKFIADPSFRSSGTTTSVSGSIAGTQRIKNEGIRDGVYYLELEMRMDDLVRSNFDESRFMTESGDLIL